MAVKWHMIVYRYQVGIEIVRKGVKIESSLNLISLMNRLNRKRVHKEFSQYPCVIQRKRSQIKESMAKADVGIM